MLAPVRLFPFCGRCLRRSADLIRRSDFSDLLEVPEEFTENQLRDAHNEVVRRLRPGAAMLSLAAALLSFPLLGGLVVERGTKGNIPNTASIVTDVRWDGDDGRSRSADDLSVYRKVKDIWTWTNWDNPDEPDARPAPADFLAAANSPSAPAIFFSGDEWFGANQYWPNGNLKYDQGYGHGGETSTNLNFAFTAYAEDGRTPLYRFGATAARRDPTNETLVSWSDVNPYVRVATTDFVDRRRADGAARPLPPYLHSVRFSGSYEPEAYAYYAEEDASGARVVPGLCSARRVGNLLERNYDWYRDHAAEFVVLGDAGPGRFASAGVANIGENLTEEFVSSGKWSKYYKCLPGRTVDGINSEGVAIEVNVVVTNGSPWETHVDGDGRDIDSRWAVRWTLDNASSAGWAASNLAGRVYLAKAMRARGYSVHYAIVDRESTWLVEDGKAIMRPSNQPLVMTNFRLDTTPGRIMENDRYGAGYERYFILTNGAVAVTNAWYSNAYRRNALGDFPWPTEFAGSVDAEGPIPNDATDRLQAWAKANIPESVPDAAFPRGAGLWQTVHTAIYDLTNLTLRVAVQEVDDWYIFQVLSAGGVKPEAVREIVSPMIGDATNALGKAKRDYTDLTYDTQTPDEDVLWNVGGGAGTLFPDFKWKPSAGRWVCWYRAYDPTSPVPEWNDDEYIERTADGFKLITEYPTFVWGNSFNPGTVVSDQSPDIVAEITSNGVMTEDTLAKVSQLPTAAEKAAWNGKQSKITASGVLKGDGSGGVSTATKSSTAQDPANADYRDPKDNTCHKTGYGGEWVASGWPVDVTFESQPKWEDVSVGPGELYLWVWTDSRGVKWYGNTESDDTESDRFDEDADIGDRSFTATRSAVCTSNELFTTPSYHDPVKADKAELENYLPASWAEDETSIFAGSASWAGRSSFTSVMTYDGTESPYSLQMTPNIRRQAYWPAVFVDGLTYELASMNDLPGNYSAVSNAAMWASNEVAHIHIDATDPTFSNAVLAVGLNIDTNSVAVLNEIAATFGDFPIGGTATTVGGLLAALAAAVALLRKKTVLLDNDGKATNDFATDILGKQVANAKVRYALSTASSATMADRTVNLYEMNGNGTITFPAATTHEGVTYARDFLLRVKVTTAGSLTLPTDVTPLGDSFDFTKANDWLIAFTEIGKDANNKAEFYIRAISLEG